MKNKLLYSISTFFFLNEMIFFIWSRSFDAKADDNPLYLIILAIEVLGYFINPVLALILFGKYIFSIIRSKQIYVVQLTLLFIYLINGFLIFHGDWMNSHTKNPLNIGLPIYICILWIVMIMNFIYFRFGKNEPIVTLIK